MKLLLAVDGSTHSLAAVRHAIDLCNQGLRADLVLVTVQGPAYLYELLLPPDGEVLERLSGVAGTKALAAAQVLLQQAGIAFERVVEVGDVVPALLQAAIQHDCDAVVMGARGLGSLEGALFGSVSRGVLEGAGVPVTIVTGTGADSVSASPAAPSSSAPPA